MYTRRGLGACGTDPSSGEAFCSVDTPLPPCSTMPAVPAAFQGPFACSGNQSDVPRFDTSGAPATQGALDQVWKYVLGLQPPKQPGGGSSFTDWLNTNKVMIGAVVLLVVGLKVATRR